MSLTHLSLFSGIGGLDLAAEWAGIETVGQCEWADYPAKVLEKHWPDVPKWRDIKTVTKESYYEYTGLRTVDIISGGFPCQPFSVAGKQKGKGDDRYLWPEMLRVVRELAPRWVLGENVPGILRIAGRTVCEDLEREGYAVAIFDFEAAAVGAPHRRERIFFVGEYVADPKSIGLQRHGAVGEPITKTRHEKGEFARMYIPDTDNRCGDVRRNGELCEIAKNEKTRRYKRSGTEKYVAGEWWSTEPDVGRVAYGVPARVDRLKCLGNAVVPQQAYPIFKAIADLEAAK